MTVELNAVILAAGQGTRMKSPLPKVLHKVLGVPMIGHVVRGARDAGAEEIVVVVGHAREMVKDYLGGTDGGDALKYAVQEEQLGTAHAVAQARSALEGRGGWTLILSGDVPNLSADSLRDFIDTALASGHPMAFISTIVEDPTGYGRIVRDEDGQPLFNVEHRDANEAQRQIREINAGFYLVDNAFLWNNLDKIGSNNDQAEFYLPDLIKLARDVSGATGYIIQDPNEVQGINTRVQLASAERYARQRFNHALMLSGITMIDPDTTYIDADVVVEPGAFFEPCVRITGKSHIHAGANILQGAVIRDSVVEAGATILPYSHVTQSTVRTNAAVGPFSHLRPESDIGPNARVGNFVEIKKSTLGNNTKASHLSYIGDATIGDHCNIGAGTITCNYDGDGKYPTTIDDNVFVGSNTALVAPIRLGKGAYVAAGSTLTSDVPEDSLGVARGRQRNIDNWKRRGRRKK